VHGLAAPLLPAFAQARWPDAPIRSGRLSFDGKSTLGDFTGITDSVLGHMTGGALREVRGWVEAPVRTLKTGNNRRDRDLVKTMEADIYPTIRFVLEGVEPQSPEADSMSVQLTGQFVIHGVSRSQRIAAQIRRTEAGIRVTATFPMNLNDYRISNLTRFLVFRMNPDIVVHVELVFGSL
jgi:polyisoprenoid-binding protein YceI